jgi:hypothetical protein
LKPLPFFVNEQRLQVNGIHFEVIRRFEVADGFQIRSGQPLIVQHTHGRVVAMKGNQFMSRKLERGLLVVRLHQLSANGKPGNGSRP